MAWTDPKTWATAEVVTAAMLNTHLRDNLNAIGQRAHIRKASDETVTSSTVLQDDNELTFAVGANQTWAVEARLFYSADSAADISAAWSVPAGTTGTHGAIGKGLTPTTDEGDAWIFATNSLTTSVAAGGQGAAVRDPWLILATIVTAGTPGNVTLQWAQRVSNATGTVMRADSLLIAERLA